MTRLALLDRKLDMSKRFQRNRQSIPAPAFGGKSTPAWGRRDVMRLLGASVIGGALGLANRSPSSPAYAAGDGSGGNGGNGHRAGAGSQNRSHHHGPYAGADSRQPVFLIVLGGFGGASIIDSFLPIRQSECANWQSINVFPDHNVVDIPDSPIRAVDLQRDFIGSLPIPFTSEQSQFARRHKNDMMVVTYTGTSVNHAVAQKRSLTGNNAWHGRTLQEVVAMEYGRELPMANVNMASLGFLELGEDPTLPPYAYAEPVSQPLLWSLSLHGHRGIPDAPDGEFIDLARELRNRKIDPESNFYQTFAKSDVLTRWQAQRELQHDLEQDDLISKLTLVPDQPPEWPLSAYGLRTSPDAEQLATTFANLFVDPLETQAALAFSLIKHRIATAVTISPNFNIVFKPPQEILSPPLAFDFSHTDHRGAQAYMWNRMLAIVDRLINLLKGEELAPDTGTSLWDRSLIYIATDFGRSKRRQGGADVFPSGHDLNNGCLILSPLVNGNRVLGGVDADTGLTYGFDPITGTADPGRTMSEAEVYAGLLGALGVSLSGTGLPSMPAMSRG